MIEIAGIEFLPPWPIFLAFAIAGLLLNLVPGQDMMFVVVTSARSGRRSGIIAAIGIGAGAFVHILAAMAGISAIIAASSSAFLALKLIGVGYLLWLAFSMARGTAFSASPPAAERTADLKLFRSAALVNISNPKVALFFLAFLPQFLSARSAFPALEILCLGLWFDVVGTLVNVAAAVMADVAARRASRFDRLKPVSRWLASSVLALLAVRLAFAHPR